MHLLRSDSGNQITASMVVVRARSGPVAMLGVDNGLWRHPSSTDPNIELVFLFVVVARHLGGALDFDVCAKLTNNSWTGQALVGL